MSKAAVVATVKQIWKHLGFKDEFVDKKLVLSGGDPDLVAKSSFKVGQLAQASTALTGLAASALYGYRISHEAAGDGARETEYAPEVGVDARHALLCFASEAYTLVDGQLPKDVWDDLAGLYPTKDGHLRIHTNFPHHRQGILDLLNCEGTREAVGKALSTREAVQFEQEATDAGMCVAAVRTFAQWDRHPQAQTLRGRLPIELVKIGDAPPRNWNPKPNRVSNAAEGVLQRPLDGIRVLELTRVLAGPTAGRALAGFGADVLWITSPNLPALPVVDIDTSRGKRAAQVDLNEEEGVKTLRTLVSNCDVFLQSYRAASLEERGLGPVDLARLRPGIVVASLRGYGWDGPWATKRAFDSLVQSATGFNTAEAEAWSHSQESSNTTIKTLPVQCLDHAAGQLLAFGIMAGLYKTTTEGGSWEVRVSLAGVGQWLRDMGQLDINKAFKGEDMPARQAPMVEEIASLSREYVVRRPVPGAGPRRLMALKSAISLSEIADTVAEVPGCLDCDSLQWL
ncbi:hypothetical protein FRC17_000345 [Serendipita sp. 399]|nr:hypothetical protein FRC17_000345 [Serendipita sp. 399]